MERKEYDSPSVNVISSVADDVIATSDIILPPHVIGRPNGNGNSSDQY